ncbi:MAG: hypothetical protein Q4B54_09630 [Coriobacteriales bacterium]|nr:hypothetical protein [Coriobacteriales bacterium]
MAKKAGRINGRHGEYISLSDEQLTFHSGAKSEKMPIAALMDIYISNPEEARKEVSGSNRYVHGQWTAEMPAVGGKSMFVVVADAKNLWVMEINKNQVPNASSFVADVKPANEDDKDRKTVPGRAIDTPMGALFTIGSIASVFVAFFLVYQFQQPILAIIVAIAGVLMYFNIK